MVKHETHKILAEWTWTPSNFIRIKRAVTTTITLITKDWLCLNIMPSRSMGTQRHGNIQRLI